jgi:hypothetical protein
MSRVRAPVEVPEDVFERVRTLCLALPEVTVRVDVSVTRTRSTAHSFDIRRYVQALARSSTITVGVLDFIQLMA